jgi:phage FluMu gp28-like protein
VVYATPKPFFPLLPYQQADVESNARFRWSCWSRQSGKSFTKSLRRLLRGLKRGRNQIFLSASERQSRELMHKTRQHCQALEIAARECKSTLLKGTRYRQLEIELPGGVRIIGLPANAETVRGFTGDVFLDEFAMHADDRAIWAAVFPTLLRGDGELDVASTPKGKKNVFYDLSLNEKFEQTTVSLPTAIDQGLNISADDIRESMGDDELYRQEFLCEFLDEATAFLTYDQIARCQDPTLDKEVDAQSLEDCGRLYVGVDIGRKRDLTVIWILERQGQSLVTRAVYERRNLAFRKQYDLLKRVLSLSNVHGCAIDAGGLGMQLAESAVEDFGPHRVEAVTFTNALKTEMASRLRIAVEETTIRIPVDEAIRNDWHSLERSITTTGHIRFEATRTVTGHADRFWSAALALRAAGKSDAEQNCLPVKPLAFATQGTW